MKKLQAFWIFICAILLVLTSLVSACSPTAPVETIKLTYSCFFPPTHLNAILAEKFCQEIMARTDNQVEITFFPGGTLTPAPQVYDGVVNGLSDIGMSVLAYSMGRFPASELVDMPHAYPNGWVATKVANDFYNKFEPSEFDDVHVLYFHAHGPSVLFTTKKPVRTMSDLKGMVIRSTGIGAKIVESLGAKGHGASQAEAYEQMSKGVVDGSYTPREVLKGWKQAEVVNYVTSCYDVGSTANMFVVINKEKWNAFPENVKKVFTKVSEEWIEKHGNVWTYYDKAGVDYFLSLEGREIIELPNEEMTKWVEATKPLIDAYIKDKTAMGLPASEYERYLIDRTKYWSGKSPSEQECFNWVQKELVQ